VFVGIIVDFGKMVHIYMAYGFIMETKMVPMYMVYGSVMETRDFGN
jgi:cytochrome b subunit of formate dehydrogenase